MKESISNPRFKVGITFWRSSLNRQLYVGTRAVNYMLPDRLGNMEVEAELKKLVREDSSSTKTRIENGSLLVGILDSLNLIDLYESEISYQYNANQVKNLQNSDRKSLAIANYIERVEIESAGLSHLPGIKDGGVSALLNRRDYGVEIHGAGRMAISIFGALIASGFNGTTLRVDGKLEVSNRDFIGGFLQSEDLGSTLTNALVKLRQGSSIFPSNYRGARPTSLVISIGRPNPERLKEWLDERIPQIYIDFEHPGEVRIGPFVRPGVGPCYNCLDLTEGEVGSPVLGASVHTAGAKFELATALALTGAGAITTEVARFAATGNSELHKKTIRISLADFYAPQVTTWERHPRCGCNWI